jgi:predicted RNA methylase
MDSHGSLHEKKLADLNPAKRKANGVYYTPAALIRHILCCTLAKELDRRQATPITILDPSCGCGAFLVKAYQMVAHRQPEIDRSRLLLDSIFGMELDPHAVQLTRRALQQRADSSGLDLSSNIHRVNALLAEPGRLFPQVLNAGGFSVVVGNPPWGQKGITADPALKQQLGQRFPSSVGIFDLFRPFVELAVRLTASGGWFGMVLPDIVLLKDYPQTRRFLLDHLTLERIDWWGMAFPGATIDTVTIIGRKRPAPAGHAVAVTVHESPPLEHAIPQADFRSNPRHTFNLHLTAAKRRILDRLAGHPRLGDFFEVHEGIHSGNVRSELFVDSMIDSTCRPLLFGRDEMAPFHLDWHGRFVRLAAVPARPTRQRYANLGRIEWHEQPKVLVRRTGDRVTAAVDRHGRFASNNFFLVLPRQPCSLDLDGLSALLNSRFMTWYFRTIEPRRGRAFAELKIKHLSVFPLPAGVRIEGGCQDLNNCGKACAAGKITSDHVDDLVCRLFGIDPGELEM